MIMGLLLALVGLARADFCFPSTCTQTVTATSTQTETATNTPIGTTTNTRTPTNTPTTAPTLWSVSGQVTAQAGTAVAGTGLIPIQLTGYEVASAGGGAQNTTIVTYTPGVAGLYRVSVVVSVTTGDTVTCAVTYTDSVNTTAQTLTIINGIILAGNTSTSGTVFVDAHTSTAILAKITISAQTTTKASAVIERLR